MIYAREVELIRFLKNTLYIGRRILIQREILERFIELNNGKDLRNKSSVVKAG